VKSSSLQFQIEKRTRSVFQLDEVYNSCCFKSHLKRIRWQKPIKKLVLLLPQRKIRCATTSLFGVGGSGRRPLEYSYYSNLHLFSSYFTFCYLRLPYVYRHAETGVGGFKRPAATCADPERALAPQLPRRDEARRSPNRERVHRARTSLRRPCVIGLFQFCALVRIS